ncbi:MAG: HAD family hydrolase [Phycisphaerales bacterium]
MLILFDIDGTLLKTHGAGLRAMSKALSDLHGPHESGTYDLAGIDTSGRLDSHIWRDLSRKHDLPHDKATHERFRERYRHHLGEGFAGDSVSEALAGARELVERLHPEPELTLGLLTGNYATTGRLKVASAGFDPDRFVVNAFADDGPDRRSLPPVAIDRYRERHGRPVAPESVLIVGDTPHDVDCAVHNGCACLAVTTGRHPADELAGADRIVDSLEAIEDLAAWILSRRAD